MSDKKESKFNLDAIQKIIYITLAVVILLSGFFATYTSALLTPIKHNQKYFHQYIDQINAKLSKLDDEVDSNTHHIAIINSRIRNIK